MSVFRQAVPLEEETFIGISSEGGGGGGNHCPRLDIMMMDCPGGSTTTRATAGLSEDEQEDLVKVVRSLLAKEDQQTKDDQIRREWRYRRYSTAANIYSSLVGCWRRRWTVGCSGPFSSSPPCRLCYS